MPSDKQIAEIKQQFKDGGMLRYKCRMCGEEFENVHVPDVNIALLHIMRSYANPWPHTGIWPSITEHHFHSDGSFGVADLIGGQRDIERT